MTEISDTYTFKNGEEEITIVMYSGLLRKLVTVSSLLTSPEEFMTNMEVQDKFIDLLLTKFDEKGNAVGKLAEPFSLPSKTVEDLMVWGYDHCLNFTLSSSTKLKNLVDRTTKDLAKISEPTQAG